MATERSREQGREGFKRVMAEKLTPYQRVKQYLMNKREPETAQYLWWGTDTTGKELYNALMQLEEEGIVKRVGDPMFTYWNNYSWQYVWEANR